jgi:hypothetical protein
MPVIPDTQEVEMGRVLVQGETLQKVNKTHLNKKAQLHGRYK